MDAESYVLAALLRGDVSHEDVAPLSAEHFFALIHRHIFEAARKTRELDEIQLALERAGWTGNTVAELANLAAYPFFLKPEVQRHAMRVVELAKRRDLVDLTDQIRVLLIHDLCSTAEAREKLRRFFIDADSRERKAAPRRAGNHPSVSKVS